MDFFSNTFLLSTKLKIPAPRKNYVVRKALFEKLAQYADLNVIFIRGGAGTGKTTLLSSFIRETGLKNICWLSLDASNTNVYSFWLYFTAAVNGFLEDDDSFMSLMLSNTDAAHMENLLTILVNRLCGDEDYYMVLDDLHCIKDAALIRTFEFFLEAMPSNFHFFMLSREDPPVYLGPLAVSGKLLFIDGRQMLLSAEEGRTFLQQTLGLTGSEEELEQLNTYAEGWIGGLQLAAAAGAIGGELNKFLRAGGGIAAEYLTREVFEALSKDEQFFLMKTGFLSYFNADICTELIEDFTATDFKLVMESLVGKNLFIICVDEKNGVYRYHNILSEYLAQRLSLTPEESQKALYIRAAEIFERRGDYEEALRIFCSAKEYESILRLARIMGGRTEAWVYLDKVPMELLMQDVDLAAQCFMYNFGIFNMERCRSLFEQFEKRYGNTDFFQIMKFAEAYFTANDGILPQYQALSPERLDLLSFGPVAKAVILAENAAALMEQMHYEEAEICAKNAIESSRGMNFYANYFAYNQLAQIYEETGRLNESLLCYTKSREFSRAPLLMSGIGTSYYVGLTGVYMRRMELEKAAEALEQCRVLVEERHIHSDIIDVTLAYHKAEMKFLCGDNKTGAAYINGILAEYPHFSILTIDRLIYELDCAEMLTPELAERFLNALDGEEYYKARPFMRIIHARLIFKRGELEEALQEADDVLAFSRLHKNKLRLVEAGLLKVFLLLHKPGKPGDQREIYNLLREAIHYAQSERLLMPFYLERSAVLPLLCQLLTQITEKDSASAAERAFIQEAAAICGPLPAAENEQEMLSAREMEVLEELALGITNREIAQKLCISQATVKTHVLSIFGKLGVSSRMLAVETGRKKGIL